MHERTKIRQHNLIKTSHRRTFKFLCTQNIFLCTPNFTGVHSKNNSHDVRITLIIRQKHYSKRNNFISSYISHQLYPLTFSKRSLNTDTDDTVISKDFFAYVYAHMYAKCFLKSSVPCPYVILIHSQLSRLQRYE